jgi:hypothetical protein
MTPCEGVLTAEACIVKCICRIVWYGVFGDRMRWIGFLVESLLEAYL